MNNINSHEEAKQALLNGHKLRNVRYTSDEFIFLNSDGLLESEEGYIHGKFQDEFWQLQLRLPERWHIIYEDSVDTVNAAKTYIGLPLHRDMDEEERYYNSRVEEYDAFLAGVRYKQTNP